MAPFDTRWTGKAVSKQTDTTDELMAINSDDSGKSSAPQAEWALLFSAWVIALAASLGALFIGDVLGQEPCNLCWYQRIAMFPLALVLGIACLYNDFSIRRYALPLAIAGGAVALCSTWASFQRPSCPAALLAHPVQT